jgi:hypothetical protein
MLRGFLFNLFRRCATKEDYDAIHVSLRMPNE